MNAVVTVSPVETFKSRMMAPTEREQLLASLPAHVKPERFERNLTNALMQNPKLLQCQPRLVYREVAKVAALGLVLDPHLGEAWLITMKSKGVDVPAARIGYRGYIKLARQSGEVTLAYAHEVHAADTFDVLLGDEKRLVHKPNLLAADRGPIVLYYAVAKFKDGDTDFEAMTLPQIYKIRERSDAWRAFKANKIKSTPWQTDEGEMSKKTVLRRLLKRLPLSPDGADAIAYEEALELGSADVEQPRRVRRAPPPPGITAQPQEPAKPAAAAPEEPEFEDGEFTDAGDEGDEGGEIVWGDEEDGPKSERDQLIDRLRGKAAQGTGALRRAIGGLSVEHQKLVDADERKRLTDAAKLADNPPQHQQDEP